MPACAALQGYRFVDWCENADLVGAIWSKSSKGAQLAVRRKLAAILQLSGFKAQASCCSLQALCSSVCHTEIQVLSVSGGDLYRPWDAAEMPQRL